MRSFVPLICLPRRDIQAISTLFSSEVRRALLKDGELMANSVAGNGCNDETLARHFAKCRGSDSLNQIIYVDLKTSLPDDLLLLTDKMTMAASIECRAPFVDHELVELASRIPSTLKVRGFSMKYLLKKAVEPWLPKEILRQKNAVLARRWARGYVTICRTW